MNSLEINATNGVHSELSALYLKQFSLLKKQEFEDVQLVMRIVTGDRRAEDEFIHRFRPQLCSLLTRLVGEPTRAEDIAHDALILVLSKLRRENISKPHRLTSYVFSTAKYSFYGWLRKKDNQLELMENLNEISFGDTSPESEYLQAESLNILRSRINRLRVKRDREILTRRYLNDQTKQEICDALELSREHYDRVISRARLRLQEQACI